MALIHLVNPLSNEWGGSENRTIELYQLLSKKADVHVWSDRRYANALAERAPIRRIRPWNYPRGGNIVFVGAYFAPGSWVARSGASRIICIYNTPQLTNFQTFRSAISASGPIPDVEFVYAAAWLQELTGVPGVIHDSPIDLNRFKPARSKASEKLFRVGRMSRDIYYKHRKLPRPGHSG